MEINIKPEDIDQYVKNAVLESTLGKNIKEALKKSLDDCFTGYRNPINEIVKKQLEEIVKEYMNKDEIKSLINQALAKVITPDAIETIVSYGVSEVRRRYQDNN